MNAPFSKPQLKNVSETLLIPLRARYLETQRPDGIIHDPLSCDILKQIGHDFSGEKEVSDMSQTGVAIRTEILDEQTRRFLDTNPEAVVVNLGCGLDTRFLRLDNGRVTWFDLDMKDVIDIRRSFFQETDRFRFIGTSVLDISWLDGIPKDRPTLFIAEGLLMYFTEDEIKPLFEAIQKKVPNAAMLFEAMSPFIARRSNTHPDVKNYDATFKWGIVSGKELETWGLGLRFVKEWYYFDRHRNRHSPMFRCLSLLPFFRKAMKIVHVSL